MTPEDKEIYYIFLDANAIYLKYPQYNIFKSTLLKNLIKVRDSYNKFFKSTREIKLIFPEIVIKERFNQEKNRINLEFNKVQKYIKKLDDSNLNTEMHQIVQKILYNLEKESNDFLETNKIEQIPASIEKYIQRIIQRKLENRKPFCIIEKDGRKYEKGFFDALIWYSILNYVKKLTEQDEWIIFPHSMEGIFIIFLTNDSDFVSTELEKEFLIETGLNIKIISFKNNYRPDILDPDFNDLLSTILADSDSNKIETIRIYYSIFEDRIEIQSIYPLPLDINILSFFSLQKQYSQTTFKENFKNQENMIKLKLKGLGFNLDSTEFEYLETKVSFVQVNLRNYKSIFLDILDIVLYFNDDSEKIIENIDMEINISEFEEGKTLTIEKDISEMLESHGFNNIDPQIISLEVEDYVEDTD